MSTPTAARPRVLVFRKRILPWSETFIGAQAGAMRRYEPVLVGYARDAGGAAYVAGWPQLLLQDHSRFPALEKLLLKATGRAPARWLRSIAVTEPALVHAHFGSSALPASHLARALGIPLVVTYHGTDATAVARTAAESDRRRRAFAVADRVLAISDFVASALRASGCPESRLMRHYVGVDTTRYAPGPGARETAEVLFVGRLVDVKGAVFLIRAMELVRRRIPAAHLVLAGDGPLRQELERESLARGVPARFLGVQTPERVVALMRHAAVLCAPSIIGARGNAEGLSMTLLEAQACALPVVATSTGGIVEIVVHGETGFLARPANAEALAEHLCALLGDATLWARMSAASRAHVESNFDLGRQTATLEAIYDDVRGKRAERSG